MNAETVWSLLWPALVLGGVVYVIALIILLIRRKPAEVSNKVPDWVRTLESFAAFTAIGVGLLGALLIGFGVGWQLTTPLLVTEQRDLAVQAWGAMAVCVGFSIFIGVVYIVSRRKQLLARRH
jgi:hypothetical protein